MNDQAKSNKINIRVILLTGLISLTVGVGSGLLINYLTEKRAKLTYDITTQEVFSGQLNNIGIFALRIANDGKREIEQILCHLSFPAGKITEKRIVGIPESARTLIGDGKEIEVNVPFLNPGEQFSIQILLAEVTQPLARPTIEVRGKGILGKQAESEKSSQGPAKEIFPIIISAVGALLTAVFFIRKVFVRKVIIKDFDELIGKTIDETGHHGDQRDTLAYALEMKSLSEEAQAIRESPRDLTYWASSDALCNKWLRLGDADRLRSGIEALNFLINYAAIHDSSQRIIMLNMARLSIFLKDVEQARKYLKIAKEKKDIIIEKRINADPGLKAIYEENGA